MDNNGGINKLIRSTFPPKRSILDHFVFRVYVLFKIAPLEGRVKQCREWMGGWKNGLAKTHNIHMGFLRISLIRLLIKIDVGWMGGWIYTYNVFGSRKLSIIHLSSIFTTPLLSPPLTPTLSL